MTSSRIQRTRTRPNFDRLEARETPSGAAATGFEQVFLDRLNAARAQLAAAKPSTAQANQPLVFSPEAKEVLLGVGEIRPRKVDAIKNALKRSGARFDPKNSVSAFEGTFTGDHEGLFEDFIPYVASVMAANARRNKNYAVHELVGVDLETSPSGTITIKLLTFAVKPRTTYMTGTVFEDRNQNGKLDEGEGLAGATVALQGGGSTTTNAVGGYALAVPAAGMLSLTATAGQFSAPITLQVKTSSKTNALANFFQ